jgi:hypothetical protein
MKQLVASTPSFSPDNQSKCLENLVNCSPIRAAELARLLFGQFRKGDANDPETWVRSVVRVLSDYPEFVVIKVTDPLSGLARKSPFLPNIYDIIQACDEWLGRLTGPKRRLLTDDDPPRSRCVDPGVISGFQHLKAELSLGSYLRRD